MKICVNEQCKAMLDDYVTRCPHCGRLQRKKEIAAQTPKPDAARDEIDKTEYVRVPLRKRNGFVTFWLVLILVGNILAAVTSFFPRTMWGSDFPDQLVIISVISGVFCLVSAFGAQMLLNWKKSGFVVIFVSILFSSVVFGIWPITNVWLRTLVHLILLPLVVGVTYEFNRWVGRHVQDSGLAKILTAPGMWMQNFTTNEPDDSMIECAIRSLELALPSEKGKDAW